MAEADPKIMTEKKAAKIWQNRDVDIQHEGSKITLPGDPAKMPIRTAIAALERKAADEERMMNVHEIIDAFPEDAMVCLHAAMRQKYGWSSAVPTPGFFGDMPPQMLTVKTGPGPLDSVQVPFGSFMLPGVENPITTHRYPHGPNGWCLVISGEVRQREANIVKDLAQLTRDLLKTNSIYQGQAIRLRADADGDLDFNKAPEFIPTAHVKAEELVLNQIEIDQVRCALWAPIENTQACIEHGIPLNRGILLEGVYGTGKTMTATVTSKVCVDNGWTYILLDDVRALKDALLFAQRYAPAVVFAEDVDRVADKRDQAGNDLLNTIDGVLTKNSQVITVLTTNHVERLDKAMLRPGRLDAVISVKPPEPQAVERLLRTYGRGLIAKGEKLDTVSEVLAGNIPATIREVVERSKLAMIANKGEKVTAEDLTIAAHGMAYHLDLLKDKPVEPSIEHKLGAAVAEVVASRLNKTEEQVEALHNHFI